MRPVETLSREELEALCTEVFALRRRVVELEAENRTLKIELSRASAAAPPVPAVPASGFAFGIVDTEGTREVVVPGTFVKIGTDASCQLKLKGARWMHAAIESDGKSVTILDFGTPEGTFVNGERIQKTTLSSGDRIGICDAQLVVVFA